MFTGIVEIQGRIYAQVFMEGDLSLEVDAAGFEQTAVKVGDSISVSGVCLTAVRVEGTRIGFDISTETLERTRLGHAGRWQVWRTSSYWTYRWFGLLRGATSSSALS